MLAVWQRRVSQARKNFDAHALGLAIIPEHPEKERENSRIVDAIEIQQQIQFAGCVTSRFDGSEREYQLPYRVHLRHHIGHCTLTSVPQRIARGMCRPVAVGCG